MSVPELLAPAGDWAALKAAVASGADAVYFGVEAFNARQRAENFRIAELPQLMHWLHERQVRGCLTLNVLVFTDELERAAQLLIAAAEAGVDAVIAQGFDAAGHTGDMGTLSIVAEVAAIAGDTPIIAAGGITTGRHLAAALCLGASGVWTGTLWLASRESDVDMIIKERLVEAQAADTVWSDAVSGFTMRVLKNPWCEEWKKPEAPRPLPSPYQMILSADYTQGANDARRPDLMYEASGQGVGFVTEMKPARQIVSDVVEEALAVFDDLVGLPD